MSIEAMKLALENCRLLAARHRKEEWAQHILRFCEDGGATANTLRAAIAQAERQEPVTKMREMLEVQGQNGNWNYDAYMQGMYNGMEFMVALAEGRDPVFRDAPEKWLYIPPQREWQGLTEDEVAQAMYRADAIITGPMQFKFAKEIEAKLEEKNT